jgi:hypothetical protein
VRHLSRSRRVFKAFGEQYKEGGGEELAALLQEKW